MEIKRSGTQPSQKGPPEQFTGAVRIDPLFTSSPPARTAGAYVTFEPCARSDWHTHPLGQTLIVTARCGLHQRWGGGRWKSSTATDAFALLGRTEKQSWSIGVSNFQSDRVMDLIVHNEVVPAVNQIETHPFHQQVETQTFLQENGVALESWGPFAEGKHDIFKNAAFTAIGARHGKTVAQVILRWLVQHGVVAIPKSVRKERIAENFDVFDFALTPEDMDQIATLDTKTSSFLDHHDPKTVKWLSNVRFDT